VRELADAVDALGRGIYLGRRNGYGLLVRVLAYCGLRWGEASGLRVQDIDFVRGRLEVCSTRSSTSTVSSSMVCPRTTKPARFLRHRQSFPRGSPVFAAARGGWLRERGFRRGWLDQVAERIGQKRLTRTSCDTAASLAISPGANVKAVQRMLGHASAAVTVHVHSDPFDRDLDAVSMAPDQAIVESTVAKTLPLDESTEVKKHN
jgi:integrase